MMNLKRQVKIAFACVVIAGGTAAAQEADVEIDVEEDCPSDTPACPVAQAPMPPPEPTPPPAEPYDDSSVVVVAPAVDRGPGYAITLGGGVSDFVDDAARSNTEVGGSWNLRATFGTNRYIAGEISYIGSAQSIDMGLTPFNDDPATLVGNGAEADLRVNATTDYPVQPFAYGGLAWRHYTLSETGDIDIADDADDVLEIPLGIGVAGHYKGFTLDARGEYRFANGEDGGMFDQIDNDGFGELDRWGVMANLGYEM